MFNRRYVMLVAVCFVLAVPVSIWAVRHWLAGFAYAVPLYWWVFALALAGCWPSRHSPSPSARGVPLTKTRPNP